MRYLAATLFACLLFASTARAQPLGECEKAARQGGPCGCWAAHHFGLPRMFRRLNLWLANQWLAFPHVAPAPGTAAVWPGRHVAPVVAVDGDKVEVNDSWGQHWVRKRGLVFVRPG